MKVPSTGRQVLHSILFSVFLTAFTLGLRQVPGTEKILHSGLLSIVLFSAFLGLLIAFMAGWGMKNLDAQTRPNLFIAITGIRMIVSLIFVLIVVYNGLENQLLWVVNFFLVYLFYLLFEIYTIISNLHTISK